MNTLQKYNEIKRKLEEATRQKDKAEGALSQIMSQLKTKFGCNSLAVASKKLTKLRQQEEEAKEEFDTTVEKFEEDWSDELG